MGLFGRMKRAVKSKANAAVDRAVSPAREIEMAILELEAQHKSALKELLAYKATAKMMEKDIAAREARARTWEQRAMVAVRKGDDALAKECLREHKSCAAELEKLRRDRNEASSYALELNQSRKQFETKIQMLKLKKGTMSTQIAAARSGTGSPFGFSDKPFERMDRAEQKIDSDAILAEVEADMGTEGIGAPSSSASEAKFDAALLTAGADPAAGAGGADDALSRLKAKMAARKTEAGDNGEPGAKLKKEP